MEVGGQHHGPASLPLGKNRYPLHVIATFSISVKIHSLEISELPVHVLTTFSRVSCTAVRIYTTNNG